MTENKNYEEIKKLINDLIGECSHGKYIFRGMNQIYNKDKEIHSSLFEKYEDVWTPYLNPKQAEKNIVDRAKRLFPSNTSHIKILTDLRHYGGEVNFIDFTRDLHIALFFACNGEMTDNGQLVMLKTDNLDILKDINYEKNEHKIALIEPVQTSISRNRVIAQKSILVYSPEGYIPKNQCLIRIIDHKYKGEILEYLRKFHNISADTIYNDLIGFIDNEKKYSSARAKFYKSFALIEEAEKQRTTKDERKKYRKAFKICSEAIVLNPNDAFLYNGRGAIKLKLGQFKEAITDCSKAIELNPNEASFYNNRGTFQLQLKQYKEAITDYNKAIELRPDYADAYNGRGSAKLHLGHPTETIRDCNKAIVLSPDYAAAYNTRGTAKLHLGHYKEALIDYNKAIELRPDYVLAYNNRGIIKFELCQYKEAIIDYNKAIELRPDYADAYNGRGGAKLRLGLYKEAIKDCNKAIDLKPDYVSAYRNRAIFRAKLGYYSKAICDLEKALQLEPKLESKLRPRINELKAKSSLSE